MSTANVERTFLAQKIKLIAETPNLGEGKFYSLAPMSFEKELLFPLERYPKWHDRVMEHFETAKQRLAEFFYQSVTAPLNVSSM